MFVLLIHKRKGKNVTCIRFQGIGATLARNRYTCNRNPDKYPVIPLLKPTGRAKHQRDNTWSQTESGTKGFVGFSQVKRS
jgi:hypothetical protein